jgi:hemerythrin
METGHPTIDRQHRAIIGLIDDLEAAEALDRTAAVRDVLIRVMDFTVSHFGMEEDLMRAVGYPPEPTLEMIEQHREFTAYARLRVMEFRSTEPDTQHPLGTFLREWLVNHEFGLDRTLVDWIREQEQAS